MKSLALWFVYNVGTMEGSMAARLQMRSDCSVTPTPRSTLAGVRVSCILHSLPACRLHHQGAPEASCWAIDQFWESEMSTDTRKLSFGINPR